MHYTVATLSVLSSLVHLGALAAPLPHARESDGAGRSRMYDVGLTSDNISALPKRGLLDAVPGILTLVGGIFDGVLNATESSVASIASLLLVEKPAESIHKSYAMSASTADSTQVYLVPSNMSLADQPAGALGVTLHVPLFTDTGMLDMCLTYDPHPANSSSISAEPCTSNSSEHASQLFQYVAETGMVIPIFTGTGMSSWTNDTTSMAISNSTWSIERDMAHDSTDADESTSDSPLASGSQALSTFTLIFTPSIAPPPSSINNDATTDTSKLSDASAQPYADPDLPETSNEGAAASSYVVLFRPSSSSAPVFSLAIPDRPDLERH